MPTVGLAGETHAVEHELLLADISIAGHGVVGARMTSTVSKRART
jgi:hypothetical protein